MLHRSPLFRSGNTLTRLHRVTATATVLAVLLFGGVSNGVLADPTYVPDHLYLYQVGGDPIDVTSTLYTSGGNTYVVLNGTPIRIQPNYQTGHIFDSAGNSIGFYYLPG